MVSHRVYFQIYVCKDTYVIIRHENSSYGIFFLFEEHFMDIGPDENVISLANDTRREEGKNISPFLEKHHYTLVHKFDYSPKFISRESRRAKKAMRDNLMKARDKAKSIGWYNNG